MYPRSFSYVAPRSLEEAMQIVADDPGAKLMAGGHSLLPLMKLRLLSPEVVVDLGRIPGLDSIEDRGDTLALGPMVTHRQAASNLLLAANATALRDAAAVVGDVQVRNRGTVCGSLAHADSVADEPGAAIAVGATMIARSVRGEREIPAHEFFVDVLTSALEADEVLAELRIPKPAQGTGSAYLKLGRRGGNSDYPIVGVAALVRVEGGAVAHACVAVTGAAARATPIAAAAQLLGRPLDDHAIASVAADAREEIEPLEDLYGSAEYKRHLVGVYMGRALRAALGRARAA